VSGIWSARRASHSSASMASKFCAGGGSAHHDPIKRDSPGLLARGEPGLPSPRRTPLAYGTSELKIRPSSTQLGLLPWSPGTQTVTVPVHWPAEPVALNSIR
jgi:hypothetical protein